MRMIVPIYRDIDGIIFHKKIEDYFSRTDIIGDVSYNQNESPKDNTIPIFMTDIANPYGIKPCGSLKIEVERVEDEISLMRQLMIILNERAIIFPDDEIKTIRDEFEGKRPLTVTIEEHDYWIALSNSIRSLERAIYELSKLNQFIHLWRSFNSLYSYIYKKDTGKNPKNTDEQTMFNHFLSCGKFITKQECRELVKLFLSKYDLRGLYESKIDAKMLTKEGWEELVEKGVCPSVLKKVVAFVYKVNRNNIFHGGEPFFVEEEIALFQASIEMLYRLLIISIPRFLNNTLNNT